MTNSICFSDSLQICGRAFNSYSCTCLFQALTSVFDIQKVIKKNLVSALLMQSEVCLIKPAGVPLSTTADRLNLATITWSQQESNSPLRWNSTMTQSINSGLSALWMSSGIDGVKQGGPDTAPI